MRALLTTSIDKNTLFDAGLKTLTPFNNNIYRISPFLFLLDLQLWEKIERFFLAIIFSVLRLQK